MMEMITTIIPGVRMIKLDRQFDHRGYFVRTYDQNWWQRQGLVTNYPQHSVSFNAVAGTMRGLHYQSAPYGETKIVRCESGSIFDVVVDLRSDSPTYGQFWSGELTSENDQQLYVPEGCAHGFLTLKPETKVIYYISGPYSPAHGVGVRWNDPNFKIRWPIPIQVISEKDQSYPDTNL